MKKAILLAGLATLLACDDDLSREDVAGTFEATTFTTTTNNVVTDQLEDGASLVMTLNANGSVTGQLVAPFDQASESMAGSWNLNDNTVTFTQNADTFVRDMDFIVSGNTLVGDDTFGNTRIRVTLTKQ